MKIAILSSHTLDLFSDNLSKTHEVLIIKYSAYQDAILNKNSSLYSFNPDVIFLSVEEFSNLINNINVLLNNFKETIIVTHTIKDAKPKALKFNKNHIKEISKINYELSSIENDNLKIIDINDIIEFDTRYYYLAEFYFSINSQVKLANTFDELLKIEFQKRKKCLICDLDNTLWGGILDEGNVCIDNHGEGRIYQDFQKMIKQLIDSGVILAICSKNDESNVFNFIESNEQIIIKKEDIAAHRINWQPKYVNILEISKELNISLDQIVFLDDSKIERESVKQMLPEVEIPDMPEDPVCYMELLSNIISLQTTNITEEDKNRNKMYVLEQDRKIEQNNYLDYNEFLHSLNMKCKIEKLNSNNINRIEQITFRTNQFNLSGKQIKSKDLPESTYCISCKDKFGDLGVVAAFVLNHLEASHVFLSCRAFARGIEELIFESIMLHFKKDYKIIFNKINKNEYAKNFIENNYNLKKIEEGYLFEEQNSKGIPKWIEIEYSEL